MPLIPEIKVAIDRLVDYVAEHQSEPDVLALIEDIPVLANAERRHGGIAKEMLPMAMHGLPRGGPEITKLALYFIHMEDYEANLNVHGIPSLGALGAAMLHSGDTRALKLVWQHLSDEARAQINSIGGGATWMDGAEYGGSGLPQEDDLGSVYLGRLDSPGVARHVYYNGDGHLLSVAPTRSGKGQCHIVPNLLAYLGSVFVLDIKNGENYRLTSNIRSYYGKIIKFAPFEDETLCFNPLAFIDSYGKGTAWSDALELADLIIVPEKDEYFQDRAKQLIATVIYFLHQHAPEEQRNMREVCRLIWSGSAAMDEVWQAMTDSGDELLVEAAEDMRSTAKNSSKEFSAIVNSAKRSLEVWRTPEVVRATSTHSHDEWWPYELRIKPALGELGDIVGPVKVAPNAVQRGMARSVYVIVPINKVRQMTSVLRVLLGLHINELIKVTNYLPELVHEGLPTAPVMFMCDEFPQLGHMAPIEQALEIGASFRMRMWLFAQDIGQIQKSYPNWKGMVSGCEVQSFMNINDNETARYVSERLGQRKPLSGGREPLASVSELMGPRFKESYVCLMRNTRPMKVKKVYAHAEAEFSEMFGETEFEGTPPPRGGKKDEPGQAARTKKPDKPAPAAAPNPGPDGAANDDAPTNKPEPEAPMPSILSLYGLDESDTDTEDDTPKDAAN